MPSENIELGSEDQRTKMPKVNATPRIREALIGIGLLCGFMIFHSKTSSENIQGEISSPTPKPIETATGMLVTFFEFWWREKDVGDSFRILVTAQLVKNIIRRQIRCWWPILNFGGINCILVTIFCTLVPITVEKCFPSHFPTLFKFILTLCMETCMLVTDLGLRV